MGRRRRTYSTLTGTRIYRRNRKFMFFAPEPMLNPKTMKLSRWHVLCAVDEGEFCARERLRDLQGGVPQIKSEGSFAPWWRQWVTRQFAKQSEKAPTDPHRKKVWEAGMKTYRSRYNIIERAFGHFDLDQIRPVDVALFLDQWEGRSAARDYRNFLSQFFEMCCRKGLLNTNPAREVSVEKPKRRTVYISHENFLAMRAALLIGPGGKPTRTGEMIQCYMDLLYLLYQRGTDIRLLRWDQIGPDGIEFTPTKTERSSGLQVKVPIGKDTRAVLEKAKRLGKKKSDYVIQTEAGTPYTASGIGHLFRLACRRIGITNMTLRDIRAKAATDASNNGYADAQVQVGLTHTDPQMTGRYIKKRAVPVSEVVLNFPTGHPDARGSTERPKKQPREDRKAPPSKQRKR